MNGKRIAMAFLAFVCTGTWADDHGDTRETATPLAAGAVAAGMLHDFNDRDYFSTVINPGDWIGFALLSPIGRGMILGMDNIGHSLSYIGTSGYIAHPAVYPKDTNYVFVTSDWEADTYRLAAMRFPTSGEPTGDLIEFTLTESQPVEARTFTVQAGQIYAVGRAGLDDANFEAMLCVIKPNEQKSDSYSEPHVMLAYIRAPLDDAQYMRILIFNENDNYSTTGDRVGMRVQPLSVATMSAGMVTGRALAACEVDGWTSNLLPNTQYNLRLTHPDGRAITNCGAYGIQVFRIDNSDPIGGPDYRSYDVTKRGSLTFTTPDTGDADGYIFTVMAFTNQSQTYLLHLIQHSDEYVTWAENIEWNDNPNGANDDPDGDGFSNDQERIAGTDPMQEGDLFEVTGAKATPAGDGLVLGIAVSGRAYKARYSTNLLLDWNLWTPVTLSIEGGQIIAPIVPDLSNPIYRLIVEME